MSASDVSQETLPPINANASGSLAGGIFQYQRALFHLFSADHESTIVGVETLDDVAIVKKASRGGRTAVLEQDKNSLKVSGQPFQDGSKNLWRTLHIWLSNLNVLKRGYQEIKFCLVTNKKIPTGAFVREMASAQSEDELNVVVKKIKLLASEAKKSKNKELVTVSLYSDSDIKFVIKRLSLSDADDVGESEFSLKYVTIQRLQLDTLTVRHGEQIYQSLLGQLVDGCNRAWQAKNPAWFQPLQFRDRLQEEITRRAVDRYLDRPIMSTKFKDYMQNDAREHLFLKQLARLNIPEDLIDKQLENYWGYYSERIRLDKAGVVLPADWDARENELHSRWDICRQNVETERLDTPGLATDDACSRKVLRETLNMTYTAKLGRHQTQHIYFTHGHYQALANDPRHQYFIYWHRQFKVVETANEGTAA